MLREDMYWLMKMHRHALNNISQHYLKTLKKLHIDNFRLFLNLMSLLGLPIMRLQIRLNTHPLIYVKRRYVLADENA